MRLILLLLIPVAMNAQLGSAWSVLNRAGDYSNTENQCYKPANVSVSGGFLDIVFQTPGATCGDTNHAPSAMGYTSGNVYWNTFNFQYGTVEFRGTLTSNHSVWTAIWMLGSNCQSTWGNTADNSGTCNWPQSGSQEVDIVELRPDRTTEGQNIFTASDTFTCAGPTADGSQHTWQFIWTATSSTWKRDGTTYCSTSATADRMNSPMWLILQIATRSGDSPSGLPQTLALDYVKVLDSGGTQIFYDDFTGTPQGGSALAGKIALGGKGVVQ